ncbi:MAG: archaeal proteasome endopeptidase complex subunit alpha [Candidatus Hodarchaeales archaeon]|jgi:proteasome alpha subunit
MMNSKVPYDKSTVIWSPEGELVQLSYARRASERGLSAAGIILDPEKRIILLAGKVKKDVLIEPQPKIRMINDDLYFMASGLSSDSNLLLQQARIVAQRHKLIYGEEVGPDSLAKIIGDLMARHTITGGLRAFGAALLVSGFKPHTSEPRLLYIDNGGSFFSAKAYAAGEDADKIVGYFRENFKAPMTAEEGKKLMLEALNFASAEKEKITDDDVEFLVVQKE